MVTDLPRRIAPLILITFVAGLSIYPAPQGLCAEPDCLKGLSPSAVAHLPAGQLYNLDNDIGETKNLYAENPKIVAHLAALLEQIQKSGRSRPIHASESKPQ